MKKISSEKRNKTDKTKENSREEKEKEDVFPEFSLLLSKDDSIKTPSETLESSKFDELSLEDKPSSPLDSSRLKILLPELDNEKLKELQKLIMSGCNSETCDLSDSKGIDVQINASEGGKKKRERKI